jgi:hypothetical protein
MIIRILLFAGVLHAPENLSKPSLRPRMAEVTSSSLVGSTPKNGAFAGMT